MAESHRARWLRRSKTIPAMLGATVAALVSLPLAAPALAVADVVRGRRQLPSVRTYLFVSQYLINDSVEIFLAPVYWLAAGFGTRLHSAASIARHQRLQWWSVALLERRARQLLGLRIEIDETDTAALEPGPVVVISRHVSLFDASLPALVFQKRGWQVRGIIMAELLADPGFDLLYGRLGSVFVPRDGGRQSTEAVAAMSKGADDQTAFVIFPEGRLFRPSVRDRAMAYLADSDPERAERLAGLTNLLPPRPGGLLKLLAANPTADVVLVDHRGLERFPKLTDIAAAIPFDDPVSVNLTRIPRSDIPTSRADQVGWIDEVWLDLDQSLSSNQSPTTQRPSRPGPDP